MILTSWGQKTTFQKFRVLSCPEKWWVVTHPFVAKKAHKITLEVRKTVEGLKNDTILKGIGNGLQIDAFRHAYWMALLTREIGWRRSNKLGKAHEKGNYKTYKKGEVEDGVLPDKISSEMDLHNNGVGIDIGKKINVENLKNEVIQAVKLGRCNTNLIS